ncbi:hypothetical protein [Rhizobium bangladeshense]|uniref:hypothetical protein n=1 Tax=Rhizobium bangladeshense TaxID=1138189 RepID=UPI0007E59518|nr:hypothetical protein [Rhizobium bangladeshense]
MFRTLLERDQLALTGPPVVGDIYVFVMEAVVRLNGEGSLLQFVTLTNGSTRTFPGAQTGCDGRSAGNEPGDTI